MRHRKKVVKLGRTAAHRDSLLANQICSLIEHLRIKTTLAKAKAVRPLAEKMLTLGKRGDISARRLAVSYLRQKSAVTKLFNEVAPRAADRKGGYTRIIKLGQRPSDAAPMAYIEWVDVPDLGSEEVIEAAVSEPKEEKAKTSSKHSHSSKKEKPAKAKATKKTRTVKKSKTAQKSAKKKTQKSGVKAKMVTKKRGKTYKKAKASSASSTKKSTRAHHTKRTEKE